MSRELINRAISGGLYVILVSISFWRGQLPSLTVILMFLVIVAYEIFFIDKKVTALFSMSIATLCYLPAYYGYIEWWILDSILLLGFVIGGFLSSFRPYRKYLRWFYPILVFLGLNRWITAILFNDSLLFSFHLWIFVTIWVFDTSAYLVGRKLGKTKILPNISPNKSLEGLLGGTIITLIVMLLVLHFSRPIPFIPINLPLAILKILAIVLFANFGDWMQSAFKRAYGIKDAGRIMPGHGGLLDRIDSVVGVAYLFAILNLLA